MAGKSIVMKVDPLIRPVVTDSGYDLFDLMYVKEGSYWFLRIVIDKPGGVTIDDCEKVSRMVEKILDENDPIEQSYTLEVSSPGIDRPLKRDSDFEKYKGSNVDVKLYKPLGDQKKFSGKLEGLHDGNVVIVDDSGELLRFPKPSVALCRLAVDL
jgi:ribosome maturation factor RimP